MKKTEKPLIYIKKVNKGDFLQKQLKPDSWISCVYPSDGVVINSIFLPLTELHAFLDSDLKEIILED